MVWYANDSSRLLLGNYSSCDGRRSGIDCRGRRQCTHPLPTIGLAVAGSVMAPSGRHRMQYRLPSDLRAVIIWRRNREVRQSVFKFSV